MSNWISLLAFLFLEGLSLLADYFIKNASLKVNLSGWPELLLGGLLYGLTAIGWFFLMREFKLLTISMFHGFGVIALTCLLGLIVFNEKLRIQEVLGIALGCCSIFLLMRFNESP